MDLRPSKDEYFLTIAWAVARRATCARKNQGVGCVLVNGLGHIVGSGYNGRPAGYEHCNDVVYEGDIMSQGGLRATYPFACKAAFDPPGTKPIGCEAVHAEQNALLQCYDKLWIDTVYVTKSPCANICTKELLNTSARRIVFADPSSDVEVAKELWLRNNSRYDKLSPLVRKLREWEYIPIRNPFS